jgi:hypothetical protein
VRIGLLITLAAFELQVPFGLGYGSWRGYVTQGS